MIHRLGPPEPPIVAPSQGTGYALPPTSEPVGLSRNRITQDRIEMVSAMIIKLSFAVGLAGLTLAVFFALIYSFLRWVLA